MVEVRGASGSYATRCASSDTRQPAVRRRCWTVSPRTALPFPSRGCAVDERMLDMSTVYVIFERAGDFRVPLIAYRSRPAATQAMRQQAGQHTIHPRSTIEVIEVRFVDE